MTLTNQYGLPTAIVDAIRNDDYDRGKSDYTVTELINSPRIVALRRKHAAEIQEDALDNIFALFGKSVHAILDKADQDAITEERLYAEVNGKLIGGQFDRLVLYSGILQDYKVTSVWSVIYPKHEWRQQLNILNYLLYRNGIADVRALQIVAILRDWSKNKARSGDNYPDKQVVIVDQEMWPVEHTEEFIRTRIALHEAAKEILPLCSAEERWEKPATFAVMKEGNKRAVKLYETREDAAAHLMALDPKGKASHRIEERPGESTRCMDYCNVSQFCTQFKEAAHANF